MAISYLNGFDDNEDDSQINGKLKDAWNSAVNTVEGAVKDAVNNVEATAKNVAAKVETAVKNGLPVVAKIGLAPSRAAFLLLVNLNVLKVAKRLAQLYQKSPESAQDLKDIWTKKFKGDWEKLKKAINKGAKSSISGKYKTGDIVGGQILGPDNIWRDIKKGSSLGITQEAAIAAATPIIIAIIGLFAKYKSDKHGDTAADVQAIADAAKTLISPDQNIATIETGEDTTTKTPFYKNPYVIGGAAVVLVGGYLLMKKRK